MEEKIVKIKNKFRSSSFLYKIKIFSSYLKIPFNLILFYKDYLSKKHHLLKSFLPHKIDEEFFGINLAPSPDEEFDDFFIERLKELKIKSVRTDYSYESNKENTERWIERLINEGFDVLLHLVQTQDDASNMDKNDCKKRWKDFFTPILEKYHNKIKLYEIGSTPNRKSWSGYTITDYIESVKIASELMTKYNVKILGPNISDFAPYFLITILRLLHKKDIHFDMVTDNLFVDRAGQPEEYDKHILGHLFKKIARMNLLKKSKMINDIAKIYGCEYPICTYTYWTIDTENRNRRRYVSEDKYANYLVRYYLIAASSGLLRRIYWGQMASYYKGIIKENIKLRTYPPLVYQKLENVGDKDKYEIRTSYYSLKFLIKTISNSNFQKIIPSTHHTYIYLFKKDEKEIYTMWTTDGNKDDLSKYIKLDYKKYELFDRDGEKREIENDITITERPLYLLEK